MKKLMLIVAAVLMLVVATVPALAQSFEFDQEAVSGDISQGYVVVVDGNGNAVASDASFFANTGNSQNLESYYFAGNIQYDNAN